MATGKRRRRASYLDRDVLAAISELALKGASAAQIRRKLETNQAFAGRLPSDRTIYRIVKEHRPPDTSGRWSPTDDDPQDAALVLDVLQFAIRFTDGFTRWFTNAEADQIARLRGMRPDMPAFEAFLVARLYLIRRACGEPCDDLDAYLVFAPWRNADAWAAYQDAVQRGLVRAVPSVVTFAA